MPLDPQLVPLARFSEGQRQPYTGRTAAEVRGSSALMSDQGVPQHLLPPVASTQDITVDGGVGALPARVYRPEGVAGSSPTVVFFHGGGFVLCSIDTHDAQCRELCRQSGAVVLSVAYRLAPETPFPGPVDDALAATRWALAHVGELGGDQARVAVAGDSAGANLAAVVSQHLRSELAGVLLIYPVVDFRDDTAYPSYREHAEDGVILTAEAMTWFREQYLQDADAGDPLASPLLGDLAGLPPTVVTVAGMDPLRDQGRAYADALSLAASPVRLLEFPGMIHGYFALGLAGTSAQAAVDETCAAFTAILAG